MKSLKVILFNLVLFILSISIVNAEEVSIKSIDLISKSEHAIEKSSPTYEGLELNLDVKFERLNDFIEYKIIIENPTNKDFDLDLENLSNSEYITYTYKYNDDKVIKANSEEEVLLKIEYLNYVLDELAEETSYTQEDKIYLNFINNVIEIPIPEEPETPEEPEIPNEPVVPEEPPKEEENPETGTSIITTIIVMSIALILFGILIKINKPKYIMFLIPLLLTIPLSIKANEKLQLKITSNIEVSVKPTMLVKGEQFNYSILNLANNNDINIKYFKRSETVPSRSVTTKVISLENAQYEVVAWFDGEDTIYWYSEATRVYLNEDCKKMFSRFSYAENFEVNLFDYSKVIDMTEMFSYLGYQSDKLNLDLSGIKADSATNLYKIFACISYNSKTANIKLNNIQIPKAEDLSYMFYYAFYNSENINIELDNWELENAKNLSNMFYGLAYNASKSEIKLDISTWKIKNVENVNSMFIYSGLHAKKIEINMSDLNLPYVNDVYNMFKSTGEYAETTIINCSKMKFGRLLKTSQMFTAAGSYGNNLYIDFSDVEFLEATSLSEMFYITGENTKEKVHINVNNLTASKVTDLSKMFKYSSKNASEIELNMDNWNIINASDLTEMFYMFGSRSPSNFEYDLTSWKVENIEKTNNMFASSFDNSADSKGGVIKVNLNGFNLSKIKDMTHMFDSFAKYATELYLDFSNWKIDDVEKMSFISFTAGGNVDYLEVNFANWELSNINDMSYAFNTLGKDAKKVKANISNWKISNSGNMSTIFRQAWQNIEEISIDASGWTIENVNDINELFYKVGYLASKADANFSNWKVKNVIDMSRMFIETFEIGTDINFSVDNWHLENVENMSQMFWFLGKNNINDIELDLTGWDTSNTTNMLEMFHSMNSLKTVYVSQLWNTSKVENSNDMLRGCTRLVGGNGTIFNSSKIDKEYARIDTPETPGYFTLKTN